MIAFRNSYNFKNENFKNLKSITNFAHIIRKERIRADRNNREFSLILFDINNGSGNPINEKNWLNLMNLKLRLHDEIGWFDDNHIALLLPETSENNAKKVIKKIFSDKNNEAFLGDFTVYSYPVNNRFHADNKSNFGIDSNIAFARSCDTPLWKRTFDITFSILFLLISSPLMLASAVLIKTVSPGPVIFKQQRVGRCGKIFNLLKFRTMTVNNNDSEHREYVKKIINYDTNGDLPLNKIPKDKRIIPFGKFLRNSCIDELPQFINVLKGEMSVVGPRPCIPYEVEEFQNWHKRRFDIVPGITGLWQVSGKNNTTFKEMIRLDLEYSNHKSFFLDLLIILKTPSVIINHMKYFKTPLYKHSPFFSSKENTEKTISRYYNNK